MIVLWPLYNQVKDICQVANAVSSGVIFLPTVPVPYRLRKILLVIFYPPLPAKHLADKGEIDKCLILWKLNFLFFRRNKTCFNMIPKHKIKRIHGHKFGAVAAERWTETNYRLLMENFYSTILGGLCITDETTAPSLLFYSIFTKNIRIIKDQIKVSLVQFGKLWS